MDLPEHFFFLLPTIMSNYMNVLEADLSLHISSAMVITLT